MPIVVLLVIVAALGAAAVVLAGRSGRQADFAPDRARFVLPDEPLHAADVDGVRFAVGLRGYRMDQVDEVMDRLAAELTERDRRLAELGGGVPEAAPVAEVESEPVEAPVPGAGPVVEDAVDRG